MSVLRFRVSTKKRFRNKAFRKIILVMVNQTQMQNDQLWDFSFSNQSSGVVRTANVLMGFQIETVEARWPPV